MHQIQPGTVVCLLDPKEFAYQTGVALRGYTIQDKGAQWQVIFRGTRRGGEKVYCLYVAVVLEEAIQGLFRAVTGKGGSRYWYPDKWAK